MLPTAKRGSSNLKPGNIREASKIMHSKAMARRMQMLMTSRECIVVGRGSRAACSGLLKTLLSFIVVLSTKRNNFMVMVKSIL